MCNAKFDRYCLNDIELPSHHCRRDAISTMELFVFRGSRARARASLSLSSAARSLALFVPRQIRYRVIFQRDYINCPGDAEAAPPPRASDHRRDRRNVVAPVIQPRTREVFLFSKVNAITLRCSRARPRATVVASRLSFPAPRGIVARFIYVAP
jgi:hypothetical protein